jgi:hypothetical protein
MTTSSPSRPRSPGRGACWTTAWNAVHQPTSSSRRATARRASGGTSSSSAPPGSSRVSWVIVCGAPLARRHRDVHAAHVVVVEHLAQHAGEPRLGLQVELAGEVLADLVLQGVSEARRKQVQPLGGEQDGADSDQVGGEHRGGALGRDLGAAGLARGRRPRPHRRRRRAAQQHRPGRGRRARRDGVVERGQGGAVRGGQQVRPAGEAATEGQRGAAGGLQRVGEAARAVGERGPAGQAPGEVAAVERGGDAGPHAQPAQHEAGGRARQDLGAQQRGDRDVVRGLQPGRAREGPEERRRRLVQRPLPGRPTCSRRPTGTRGRTGWPCRRRTSRPRRSWRPQPRRPTRPP